MERQPATDKDSDSSESEIESLKRERARLRIAYITLYQQFMDLDEHCNGHHNYHRPTE